MTHDDDPTRDLPTRHDMPLPWSWRIFCVVALAVAVGEIALTVAILAGGA